MKGWKASSNHFGVFVLSLAPERRISSIWSDEIDITSLVWLEVEVLTFAGLRAVSHTRRADATPLSEAQLDLSFAPNACDLATVHKQCRLKGRGRSLAMFASRTTRAIGFPYRDCGRRVFASSKSAGQNRQSGAPSGLKDGTATSSLSQAMRMSSRIIAFCLAFHITATYVISYNDCYGISMLPTFNSSGDCVLTSKWYRRGRGIQVGDIVSYEHPIRPGERAIKRVIGLEGDFVLRDTPGVGDGVMIQVGFSSSMRLHPSCLSS